ncbi:MAG: tandem-95 repeat protein [Caldilineaceae bacterium]|nr:tandem-95 repeat protein [Caldilineaceae bacterium]MBP8107044.1 tandem-95 repeat protein [Caldilineaceae bacterium]MBP8121082.1 tandem-95 repeat protein [Caldilineaceae bacterium]MBP9070801.1 tandem-95 repeat protein [Caldilineaceae bacterium]
MTKPFSNYRSIPVALALLLTAVLLWVGAGASTAKTDASAWTTNGPAGATVWSMVMDPNNTSNVYAGTSNGVFKSTDAGGSWSATSITGFSGNPVFVAIDLVTPSTLYASREGDLYKSTDSGANWSTMTGPEPTYHRAIAVDPSTPTTLYVGIRGGSSVYKSMDGGVTWSAVYPGGSFVADMILVDPNNPGTVYAGGGGFAPLLYKSTDGGATWTNASTGLTGVSIRSVAIDPTNANTLYVGVNGSSGGVFKSTDGGATWGASNNGLTPTDAYPVVVDPNDANKLYAGTFGGGVFQSSDGGASWTAINDGLTTLNVYSFMVDPSNSENLYAGTAGGGVFIQAANAAPDAVDDTALTSVNTPVNINVLANDSDPNNDSLNISGVSAASNGTAAISGAQIVYTPTIDFTGTNTFTYTVSDGSLTDSAMVTVTVRADVGNCTNKENLISQLQRTSFYQDANPVYASAGQSFTVPNGVTLIDGINAYFGFIAENATITLNLYNGPASGTIGTPIATATYTNAGSRIDAPSGSDLERSFTFSSPVSLTPGNVYYYLLSPSYNPVAFSYAFANGSPYTEGRALSGTSSGTVGAWDYDLKFAVYLCGEETNAAPVAVDDTALTSVNTPVSINVLANDSDPDGDTLSISGVSAASNGTAAVSGVQIAYTPTTDFTGAATFTYTVSDGSLIDSAMVTVTVRADVGICTNKTGLIEQLQSNSSAQHANPVYASAGQSFTVPTGVTTADGITAYYTYVAANGTITLNLYNGPATGNIGTPIATATYTNPGAALSDAEVHFRFNSPVSLTPGNVYYYLMSPSYNNPTVFGFVTATNNPYSGGTYLSGGSNGTVSSSPFPEWDLKFSIFLCEPDTNSAPDAVDDTAITGVNTPVNIDVLANDTDSDGDTLSISAVSAAGNGTAAISGGQVAYTPTTDFTGTDTFTYTVSDGSLTDSAIVTVTVHAGPISLQSVNYPERHLIAKADGSAVELLDIPDHSSGEVQKQAEFLLKPGIADASMVSIQVNDSSGRYMVATSNGVVLKTLSEIMNGVGNGADCTPFEGWTRCKMITDPKIRIMGTARVSQSDMDIVAQIYTEMAARFKSAYPKDVLNGYVVYITNGEPWSEINGLGPIGVTLGPNDEGDFLRGGASRDYLWISEQMICKTGIVTRPDDNETRTFDQVIHEFAHTIHQNYGLEGRIEQIYSGAAQPMEDFAWGIQHWFSSPAGTLTSEQSAFIGEIFSGTTTFSCGAYTPGNAPDPTNVGGSATAQDGTLPMPAGYAIDGRALERGRKYVSPSGNHYLIFQEDGNLVVNTSTDNRVWALSEVLPNYANVENVRMGRDANLVVTGADNAYIWSALTENPDPRALLSLAPNGALQIVSDRRGVLWSSDGNLTLVASGNDATFKKVPGLIGSGMSFESIVQPNYYLRHYQFLLRLDPSNGSNLFLNDASFIEVEPLNTPPTDGNGDGIPDDQQANVETFRSGTGNAVTLAAPTDVTLSNVQAMTPTVAPPANVGLPQGLIGFEAAGISAGGSLSMTLILQQGATATSYWKYGKTPDNQTDHWYEFLYDATSKTGAIINGRTITLYFVDGKRGDSDLTANGVITDPGGPGGIALNESIYLPITLRQ